MALVFKQGQSMTDCPNCEYHRQRAQRWRDEAYRQAGHPLPESEWVGLTDEEIKQMGLNNYRQVVREVEAKLKEKNT
jgi:hypothetical protein